MRTAPIAWCINNISVNVGSSDHGEHGVLYRNRVSGSAFEYKYTQHQP